MPLNTGMIEVIFIVRANFRPLSVLKHCSYVPFPDIKNFTQLFSFPTEIFFFFGGGGVEGSRKEAFNRI
jgi:hypothetical protein